MKAARTARARWPWRRTARSGDPVAEGVKQPGSVVLTKRFGVDVREPTAAQLDEALRELFAPAAERDGHGSASLWLGAGRGPAFVLEFSFAGGARFEQWADAACTRELEPGRQGVVRGPQEALALWTLLAAGDVAAVRAWRWEP